MTATVSHALARLRARRGRALLAAGGIAAACAMLGAGVTVSYALNAGFDRAANRADLPDVIARFDPHGLGTVRARIRTLPNVAAVSYRLEERRVHVWTPGVAEISSGQIEGVLPGRRGYAVVAGRDLGGRPGEAVVERGLAQAWHLTPGDTIDFRTSGSSPRFGSARVVGIAVDPDNVAYPLASSPRIWMPYETVRSFFVPGQGEPVDQALIWVNDRSRLDVTLEQARAASFGIGGLVFVTRDGIRVLVDQAAGIVVALLVAFSLVALAGAGVMLAASSRAEVERRLEAFATLRALGASRRGIVIATALETALLALPAAAIGLTVGWAAASGPSDRLLSALDQFPPGWSLLPPLAACLAAVLLLVVLTGAWPTWRACRQPIASGLRGAELGSHPRGGALPGGSLGLGMRMVVSRPVRSLATFAVLAASAAVVLLMLALASELNSLEHNPSAVGKLYQLTARGSVQALDRVRALPGVAGAAQRFSNDVADSFNLGETFQLIAYCGNRLRFEAPPLQAGRRAVHPGEAEVGLGLATALGLRPGATLAAQFSDGDEARFRVVGVVRALDNDGRIAYVQPGAEICDFRGGTTVVQVASGASVSAVAAELNRSGRPSQTVAGVTTRNAAFLGVLAELLRVIAAIDGLVCLYAMAQMLALTAYERRSAVALLRALGAGRRQLSAVFGGASLVVVGLAAPVAIVLERSVLGPQAGRLAAPYADVSLRAGAAEIAITLAGLAGIAAAASVWVARGAMRRSIVGTLRAE